MTIGFIGLGRMGRGMAMNLLRSCGRIIVYDKNPTAMQTLAGEGAEAAGSVGEIAEKSDVIFTSLPGPPEIEAVVLGEDGVLERLRPGTPVFDLSTNSLAVVRKIDRAFQEKGATFLDAPVSGGPAGAASGDLVLWVGGDPAAFEAHVNALKSIGKAARHVGAIGAGTVTKLAHNMLGYMILLAEAEIFSMAVKGGVDPLDLWESLRLGLVGRSSPLDMLVNQFLPGHYDTPAFAQKLAHKDVTLATELARDLGVPMRLANLTLAEMTEAVALGMGEKDSRAYLQLQLRRAGVEIAVDRDRLQRSVEAAKQQIRTSFGSIA